MLVGRPRQGDAAAQKLAQVIEDFALAGVRRLHPEQQAADALDLTKGTENRVAQLQFDPQALIHRALQQLRQQATAALPGDWQRAEQ